MDSSPHLRDDVRALQRELGRWGYGSLIPDGELGPLTESAVRHFQRKHGIDDDGVVGPKVWRALSESSPRRAAGVGFVAPSPAPTAAEPAPKTASPVASGGGPSWMEIATKEKGVHEIKGKDANPRIREYHASTTLKAKSDEVAWCSSFVNWCLGRAGVEGTHLASAASWVHWGAACTARYGAIAVIYSAGAANSSTSRSGNHVAFLVEETPTHYVLLGGNQSDSVKVSSFPKRKWKLKGYRWPAT